MFLPQLVQTIHIEAIYRKQRIIIGAALFKCRQQFGHPFPAIIFNKKGNNPVALGIRKIRFIRIR